VKGGGGHVTLQLTQICRFMGPFAASKPPFPAARRAIHNLFALSISPGKTDETLIFRAIRDEFANMAKTTLTTLTKAFRAPVFFDAAQA